MSTGKHSGLAPVLYLAVVGGGEIKDLARLSPLLDKEGEEEKALDKEGEEEEKEKEGEQEEKEKEGKQEEKAEELWAEFQMLAGGSQASLVLYELKRQLVRDTKLGPRPRDRERGRWILTKAYSVDHLNNNCQEQVLSLINRKERKVCPKASSISSDCWSRVVYSGYLICSTKCYEHLCYVDRFWIEKEEIARGSSCSVHKCSLKDNSTVHFAIKKMRCSYEELREVHIMSCISDSTVPKFYQAWVHTEPGSGFSLRSTQNVMILMELCARDLRKVLYDLNHEITVQDRWSLLNKVAMCIKHLHGSGVIHRDLKSNNFFFGHDGVLKVGDFGHSCWKSDCELGSIHLGTMLFRAPELNASAVTTEKVDIYSLGAMYIEMFLASKGDQMKAFNGLSALSSGYIKLAGIS